MTMKIDRAATDLFGDEHFLWLFFPASVRAPKYVNRLTKTVLILRTVQRYQHSI